MVADGLGLPAPATKVHQPPVIAVVAPINPDAPLTAADVLSMFADLKTALLKEVRSSVKEEVDARIKPSTSASNSFNPNKFHDVEDTRESCCSTIKGRRWC